MSFQGLQARFRRLHQESTAWKLLRADNAPVILAFLADLFDEDNAVSFGRARSALSTTLKLCRESGIWQTETSASTYLNQWIQSGWLRELDDQLSKTDACEVALRFCQNLEQRDVSTTASHLRIVQEAVRDFAVAISPSPNERITMLKYRKNEIQRQIEDLQAGIVSILSESEQHERLREIYQLASVLTGDFRRVEDEIRELDQAVRVQMIECGANRGDILQEVLNKEQLLAETDSGRAFEGFFQLLCDQNRTLEFRDQLRSILSRPVADRLSTQQQQFLAQLFRELSRESERVFQIRRRTEESLRAYVESGTFFENRAVDRLLGQLERLAVTFKGTGVDLKTSTQLHLPVGIARISSPDSLRLRPPDEHMDTTGVQAHVNATTPSSAMLDHLESVPVIEVAYRMRQALRQVGPMTIAGFAQQQPVTAGLEELVALLRVAKAVGATTLNDRERVEVRDRQGIRIKASIPRYLLSAELFPDNMDTLVV